MVVPARDEEGRVGGCVGALLAQDAAVVEVVVVDDGSGDGTAAEAGRAGARVVAVPPPPPGVAGKAAACAHGARVATAGRWLAFVDADVVLAPEAVSRLLAGCLATGAAAASPLARQATRTWWEELLLPDLGLAVAERLDLDAVADPGHPAAFLSGQCLLVRRDAYDAVGGFAAVAGSLVEDVALAGRLKAAGHRLDVRLAPDLAAVRMYGRFGDLWEGLAKNLAEVWGTGAGSLAWQAARAACRVGALAGPGRPAAGPGRPGGPGRRPAPADRPGRGAAGRRGRPAPRPRLPAGRPGPAGRLRRLRPPPPHRRPAHLEGPHLPGRRPVGRAGP